MVSLNRSLCGLAFLLGLPLANATNGYFPHGYGLKGKGMGGVSTALAQDSFGGANNPASMVWVGNRLDLGLDWFRPSRGAERSGSAPGLNGSVESIKPTTSSSRKPASTTCCATTCRWASPSMATAA